jgi:hypothetical protein
LSDPAEAAPPAAPRNRSRGARKAARSRKAERELRIVRYLNGGVMIAEIAARERVTEKRMRAQVREILAKRMPQPPAEFLALQVSRLNEALLVSHAAMSGANLQAVDRVVKIVRELDRYHGFAGREIYARLEAARDVAQARLALEAPRTRRPEKAPQAIEKTQFTPGNGAPLLNHGTSMETCLPADARADEAEAPPAPTLPP